MSLDNKYGKCVNCNIEMKPIWFKEDEYVIKDGIRVRTGRTRSACSHLECPMCGKRECVDDSFDSSWSN